MIALGQHIEASNEGQAAVGLVPLQHFQGRIQFIDRVGGVAVGMEAQRARPGARPGMIRSGRLQHRRLGVQRVDVDAILSQVVDVCEPIIGRERRKMRVCFLLPVLVRPVANIDFVPHRRAELALCHQKTGC